MKLRLIVVAALLTMGCGDQFPGTTGGAGGENTAGNDAIGGGGSTGVGGCDNGVDNDADGWGACEDCDDTDGARYPGATEICGDNLAQDCGAEADPQEACLGLGTFVSALGDDNNPGTQEKPVQTIGKGILNATTIGGGHDVYVSIGTYEEKVTLEEGVSVLGGLDPSVWQRLPGAYSVLLNVDPGGVTSVLGTTNDTEMSGFEIHGLDGAGAGVLSIGVTLDSASPWLRDNVILAGITTGGTGRSVGVYVTGTTPEDGPLLQDNDIQAASAGGDSRGVEVDGLSTKVVLDQSSIRAAAGVSSMALYIKSSAPGTIVRKSILQSGAALDAGVSFGVVSGGHVALDANVINLGVNDMQEALATCAGSMRFCGGIWIFGGSAAITNNYVSGADAKRSAALFVREQDAVVFDGVTAHNNWLDGGGKSTPVDGSESAAVALAAKAGPAGPTDSQVAILRNNIFSLGVNKLGFGIFEELVSGKTVTPIHDHNLYFGVATPMEDFYYRDTDGNNGVTFVASLDKLPGGDIGNLSADPQMDFVPGAHLPAGSPCVDAGTEDGAPPTDFEGEARPRGAFDIGPDEYHP